MEAGRISFFVWVILNYSALLQVIGCNTNLMLRNYQSQAGLGLLVWMGNSKLGLTAVHKVVVVHLLYFMLIHSVFLFIFFKILLTRWRVHSNLLFWNIISACGIVPSTIFGTCQIYCFWGKHEKLEINITVTSSIFPLVHSLLCNAATYVRVELHKRLRSRQNTRQQIIV